MQKADFFVKFEVPQRQQLFCAPEGAGGGCCVHRGPLKMHRVPTGGCFAHTNICSVPEKGVSGTEYHSCTRKACFLHRMLPKTHSVPQEAFLSTARIFRTTEGPLRYRMPQTQRSHILRRRLPRHQHPHYSHPPHGSHALITDIRLMEAAWDKKQPLCGKTSATFSKNCGNFHAVFFIFVPNKYRNTQCKLFTTNTTNSWNLPR